MSLSNDDVLKILKLIDESGYDDVRLEIGDIKLTVQKHGVREPVSQPAFPERSIAAPAPAVPAIAAAAAAGPAVSSAATRAEPIEEGLVAIRSPMLGTFFRAPSPGEKPFVEVGAEVNAADTVCLVEVMKLFNSVKAGVAGTIFEIRAENGAMVEHDQVLMLIKQG
ncbi:MAG: acetyl-CoA carboxylase biotin carboxyl carrier protein [Betaproteobacteria bacterium]|nr:acetyl-CoA carboxylase biotin carboxyl carrier protein [Betaproteobacteria bacterium]